MLYENTGLLPFEEACDWVSYPLITRTWCCLSNFICIMQFNLCRLHLATQNEFSDIIEILHYTCILQERGENNKSILFAVRFNSMKDREHLSFSYGIPKLNKYINTMCYDCQWDKFWATLNKKPTWHFGNDCFIVFINTCTTLV